MDESSIRSKMQQVLELVGSDIASVRTGRATPSLIEDVKVGVYGGTQHLTVKELASINVSDPQTLIISPWDKSIMGEIRKGIQEANLGFNPSMDSEIIRISLPPMTTEDREKYVRLLHTKLENGRIMIRQIRGDVMHDIKEGFEKKEITEDEKFAQEKKLQAFTDEFVGKIEEMGKIKEQELMQL